MLCKACFGPSLCVFHTIWVLLLGGWLPRGPGHNLLMHFSSLSSSRLSLSPLRGALPKAIEFFFPWYGAAHGHAQEPIPSSAVEFWGESVRKNRALVPRSNIAGERLWLCERNSPPVVAAMLNYAALEDEDWTHHQKAEIEEWQAQHGHKPKGEQP